VPRGSTISIIAGSHRLTTLLQCSLSGTSAIRLAVSEINEKGMIPGAYITLVLKDSFNGMDPENSGAAQAIFSTVALLQTDGGVSGVIGDVSSALTVQSALLTSRLSIPQCSYSAGSSKMFFTHPVLTCTHLCEVA
jgi:ABC-type branched-subunit amino acid transport system substrate-binding protein